MAGRVVILGPSLGLKIAALLHEEEFPPEDEFTPDKCDDCMGMAGKIVQLIVNESEDVDDPQ